MRVYLCVYSELLPSRSCYSLLVKLIVDRLAVPFFIAYTRIGFVVIVAAGIYVGCCWNCCIAAIKSIIIITKSQREKKNLPADLLFCWVLCGRKYSIKHLVKDSLCLRLVVNMLRRHFHSHSKFVVAFIWLQITTSSYICSNVYIIKYIIVYKMPFHLFALQIVLPNLQDYASQS